MITLSTSHCNLEIRPEKASWSWEAASSGMPAIRNGSLKLSYRLMGRKWHALDREWKHCQVVDQGQFSSRHGSLQQVTLRLSGSPGGLVVEVTFALAAELPCLLWQLAIHNNGTASAEIGEIQMLQAGSLPGKPGKTPESRVHMNGRANDLSFYSNGWQSWSYTSLYRNTDRQVHSFLGMLQEPMVLNPGTPRIRRQGHFSADFFGVLSNVQTRRGLLVGFLSQKAHFGSAEVWLGDEPGLRLWANGDRARLDPGKSIRTDWAILTPVNLDHPDPLGPYLEAVARENQVEQLKQAPAGWCSWYHFYQNITAGVIEQNLDALESLRERLPLELVQIDDGFEKQIGDWFDFRTGFPAGVAPLAQHIQSRGFIPGIWLAPFIVHPRSALAQAHPDWLLKTHHGGRANAGYGWKALNYGLDLTVPAALEYASHVVQTAVHEWGFPYIKLDFLYAAALECQYSDPTRTRAQVMYRGMQALREAAGPDAFLLGCGLPLGSGLGLVDANRIGADVSGSWLPERGRSLIFNKNEPCYPSARNSIQNILSRAPLNNHWWINDPDCLLVRPDTSLTLAEVQSLATAIALTGGSLLLSDDLPSLPEDRLHIAEVLLPLIPNRPRLPDFFESTRPTCLVTDMRGAAGEWTLAALFNWDDKPRMLTLDPARLGLPEGTYQAFSFWDGQYSLLQNTAAEIGPIPAHGVVLFSLHQKTSSPAYLGSTLHISQGMEVCAWTQHNNALTISLDLPRRAAGDIYLALDRKPLSALLNHQPVNWEEISSGIYRFRVEFDCQADLELNFQAM